MKKKQIKKIKWDFTKQNIICDCPEMWVIRLEDGRCEMCNAGRRLISRDVVMQMKIMIEGGNTYRSVALDFGMKTYEVYNYVNYYKLL